MIMHEFAVRAFSARSTASTHFGTVERCALLSFLDPDLAWTYHNFGLLYSDQGKMAEAEEMYMRALRGKEKALGAVHTSTLDTVHNLGNLYSDQGKMAEANWWRAESSPPAVGIASISQTRYKHKVQRHYRNLAP